MKRLFLVFVLLLLAGCGANTETVMEDEGLKTTQISDLDKMILESKGATEAKHRVGKRTTLEINNRKANTGDYVLFGLVISNINSKESNFMVGAEFYEAKDFNNNKISVDKETMNGWLSPNNFELFTLGSGENKFVPVIVKVGSETSSGIATEPGSYKFEIQAYTNLEGSRSDEYDGKQIVFITVKE
ncbi:hypothetical protein ACFLZ7_03415 [Nanoarchaeota archaeon]